MVRGPFQDAHEKVTVTGPVALVTIGPDAGATPTVYRIARPADAEARSVRAGDPDRPVNPRSSASVDDFGTNRLTPGRTLRHAAWIAVTTGTGR